MAVRTLRIENRAGHLVLRGGRLMGARLLGELARECRFRVDLICERLEISDRHLHRVFSDSIGLAPKDWLRRQRMVVARFLLRNGASIKEVSIELGFAHPKDFTREFRVCYQITPSMFIDREAERAF